MKKDHGLSAPLIWLPCLLLLTAASNAAVYRVGVSLPLSGENEIQGKAMQFGVQLYFDLLSADGNLNGNTFELVIRDDRNDKTQAQQVAQEFAADPTVLAVIGHQFSSIAMAAGEVYESQALVNLSPSASNPAVTQGRPWVFSMNYHDNMQGQFIASYPKAIMGIDRVAVIHTDDAYGQGLLQSFLAKAGRVDLDVTKVLSFSKGTKLEIDQLREELEDISGAPEGIVLFTHTDDGIRLVREIRRSGLAVPIIGPDAFSKTIFIEGLGEDIANVFVTSPFLYELASLKTKRFVDLYTQNYYEDHRIRHTLWSAFAYDAAHLIAEAVRHAGADRGAVREYLTGLQSPAKAINGITGDLYFDEHGAMQRQVVVSWIENGVFKPAYTQLRAVREAHVLNNLEKNTAVGNVVVVDNVPFYRTQVVYTGLDVFRINNVDIGAQRFDAEFFLWFKWMGDVDVNSIDFLNSVFTEENQKEILREDRSGPVRYVAYKLKNAFLYPFDLRLFPFDTQALPMTLSDSNKDANQLQLVIDGNNLSSGKLEKIYPEEWTYRGRVDYSGTYEQQSTFGDPSYGKGTSKVNFSVYESKITIKRILMPYLLTIFLPLGLLMVMTLLLFLIPVEEFDARLTIVMSALLGVLVFHMAQGDALPNVGYLVTADIYFILAYVLMFALILHTVVVHRMIRSDRLDQAIRVNRLFSWVFIPMAPAAFLLITMLSM